MDKNTTVRPQRRSIRLRDYDYTTPASYFVTIRTAGRGLLFSDHILRDIAESCWAAIPAHFPAVGLDTFIVMPNHVHSILMLEEATVTSRSTAVSGVKAGSLSAVVRSFKAAITRAVRDCLDARTSIYGSGTSTST